MTAEITERVPEVVITLGARGALYGSRDGERLHVPAVEVKPVDTTAAGDTFAGALAVARAEGRPPAQALRFAAAAAALSVRTTISACSTTARGSVRCSVCGPGDRRALRGQRGHPT